MSGVREPWFAALVRKLAAPPKRGGIRLTQDDSVRLLGLLKAASDVAETHHGYPPSRFTTNGNEHIPVSKLATLRDALGAANSQPQAEE